MVVAAEVGKVLDTILSPVYGKEVQMCQEVMASGMGHIKRGHGDGNSYSGRGSKSYVTW